MPYWGKLQQQFTELLEWMDVKKEQGADLRGVERELRQTISAMTRRVEKLDPGKWDEPSDLESIFKMRPRAGRIPEYRLTPDQLYDHMLGAWLGRSAGCVLGIPVEGRDRRFIEAWARKNGQPYPLAEYFKDYPGVPTSHYSEVKDSFLKEKIDHIGPDDDLVYSVLGLLILEQYGIDFTPEDVGKAWVQYLPMACTAERVALDNLRAGLQPPETALRGNPYYEWIGADIRSDPWGYCAPGLPQVAAEFAWRDASVSHVKNGIYGEMFFSAAIAAAFVCETPRQALEIALGQIPARSRMAATVKQALKWCDTDGDWSVSHDRVYSEYARMSSVHTLNNAALTVLGLVYGGGDFEKTIAFTVMGGLDTDCTGATAGSIIGAILGAQKLPPKWTKPLGDRLTTYLIGEEEQSVSNLARRCCTVAQAVRDRH